VFNYLTQLQPIRENVLLIELHRGLNCIDIHLNCPVKYPTVTVLHCKLIYNHPKIVRNASQIMADIATVNWLFKILLKMAWAAYMKVAQWYTIKWPKMPPNEWPIWPM